MENTPSVLQQPKKPGANRVNIIMTNLSINTMVQNTLHPCSRLSCGSRLTLANKAKQLQISVCYSDSLPSWPHQKVLSYLS